MSPRFMSFLTFFLSFSGVSAFMPNIVKPQLPPQSPKHQVILKPILSNATEESGQSMLFNINANENYAIQDYVNESAVASPRLKEDILQIIQMIDDLSPSQKKNIGVLMRSKKLKGNWFEQLNPFAQSAFEYLAYCWGPQWSVYNDAVFDNLIKKSFRAFGGQQLLKEILIYLKQDSNLFTLTTSDKIHLSKDDDYVLVKRKLLELDLQRENDNAARRNERERDREMRYEERRDQERRDEEKKGIERKYKSQDADVALGFMAVKLIFDFGSRWLFDARGRELKKNLKAYSLDRTIEEHQKAQKLFQKLLTGSKGKVNELMNSVLKSKDYKDITQEFYPYRLTYENAEATLRMYLLDHEILDKIAGLIKDPAYA